MEESTDAFSDIGFDDPITLEQPKPKRQRAPKSESSEAQSADAFIGDGEKKSTRAPRQSRSKKLNGKQVSEAIEVGSDLIVLLTKEGHWHIPASECAEWSDQAADLMNRIPAKYIENAVNLSGYAAVAFGVYSVLTPRLAQSQAIRAERSAAARAAQQEANANGEGAESAFAWQPSAAA